MDYNFYGVNIETPLSLALNSNDWDTSVIGRLSTKTQDEGNTAIYIREIPDNSQSAEYGWRIVDAYFSQEDSLITYFKAYDLDGTFLPQAAFGVNYSSVPQRISGRFAYKPEFGNRYYVPVQNNFVTQSTGGYAVQVLDLNYPSEALAFGMFKQGAQHQNLVISFRLFKLGTGYPNDLNMPIR